MQKLGLYLLLIVLLCGPAAAQEAIPPARVDAVYFYGLGGRDAAQIKAALPFKEGERFSTMIELVETRPKVEAAVKRSTGLAATDVSYVSPGGEAWWVYIGVAGGSVKPFRYDRAPNGNARLPDEAMRLHREAEEAFMNAMRRGHAGEDDSRGYALSADDEELRSKQLAMRDWSVRNEAAIFAALRGSADVNHRRAAAQLMGYAARSPRQIAALVRASRDADDTVRNNATRALVVLAKSDTRTAASIPAGDFVAMLNSGEWTDRNKASWLLTELTKERPPRVLSLIRRDALESLIEMSYWANDHAQAARLLLGRIAGIEEAKLAELSRDDARAAEIVAAARRAGR